MNNHSQALITARRDGFLVTRDSWHRVEHCWRAECDIRGVPSIVIFIRRGSVYLYIDPPRPMKETAANILWPRFLAVAERHRLREFVCSSGFCSITVPHTGLQDIRALAVNAATLVRSINDICPERVPKEQQA